MVKNMLQQSCFRCTKPLSPNVFLTTSLIVSIKEVFFYEKYSMLRRVSQHIRLMECHQTCFQGKVALTSKKNTIVF